MQVWVVAGTRPEIVKLAPVYRALARCEALSPIWISTGQHTTLAEQALDCFRIEPDLSLELPRSRPESVASVLGQLIVQLSTEMAERRPAIVIVQGDTTTALAAALAAFGNGIAVAHVEAGLRTFDLKNPYPEEAWRVLIDKVSELHFAPTPRAAGNLAREGISRETTLVTGNTVIDALHWLADGHLPPCPCNAPRTVLTTLHRRENWGGPLERICGAIVELAARFADTEFEFVAHANPALRQKADGALAGHANIRVLEPMDYCNFVARIHNASLIMTDSGGIQEEAPAFGVPVLVLRNATERPEALEAGVAKLVGTERGKVVAAASELLSDPAALAAMSHVTNPFGDGNAAPRIAACIEEFVVQRNAGVRQLISAE